MATPTTSGMNNAADSLKRNAIGSPADGRKLNGTGDAGSDINSGLSVKSDIPVSVKKVDFKDLKTGEDFRTQAQGGTNPLAGNDTPVRGETTNDENAGA